MGQAFKDAGKVLKEQPSASFGQQARIYSDHLSGPFDFYLSLPAAQRKILEMARLIYADLVDTDTVKLVQSSRSLRPKSVEAVRDELAKIFKPYTPESLAKHIAKCKQQSREDVVAEVAEAEKFFALLPRATQAFVLNILSMKSSIPVTSLTEVAIHSWERANSGHDEEIISNAVARSEAFRLDAVATSIYDFLKTVTKPSTLGRIKEAVAKKLPEAEFMDLSLNAAETLRVLMNKMAAGQKLSYDFIIAATNIREPLVEALQIIEDAVLSVAPAPHIGLVPVAEQSSQTPAAGPA